MDKVKIATRILVLYICFVFIQSLFFKFSGAPETVHIFGVLDKWASDTFGIAGLFVPPGIFNAYVIGSAELVASVAMLAGLFTAHKVLVPAGALLSFGIITGAISFHLLTPLGVNVEGDGGTLFYMACGVWVSALALLAMHKDLLLGLLKRG